MLTTYTHDGSVLGCTVPCGVAAFSILNGETIDTWSDRIIDFRRKHDRYEDEFTQWHKGYRFYSDRSTLYYKEAIHFLKPWAKGSVICLPRKIQLKNLVENHLKPKRTYFIWLDEHAGVVHDKQFFDNGRHEDDWPRQKARFYLEIDLQKVKPIG